VLLSRVSRKVHDKRLLKLIGRYLRAGMLLVDLVAFAEDQDSETAVAGSSFGRSDQPRLLSQRPLANVRQPSDPDGDVHRVVDRPRTVKP